MRLVRILALLAILSLPVQSQVPTGATQGFNYVDFTSVASLVMNGSATQNVNVLELTPLVNWNAGSAYHMTRMPVRWGFDTTFTFQITPPSGPGSGADGMAFIIHDGSAGVSAIGQSGGPLAYGGAGAIDNSLVIELDTWQNFEYGDTADNEISIHTKGTLPNDMDEVWSIGRHLPTTDMSDGMPHTLRVEYVPGTLNVYLDNLTTPVLTVPYDFDTGGTYIAGGTAGGLSLPTDDALVGFTGSTGGAPQLNHVLSWSWTSTLPYDVCFAGSVGATSQGPYDVLRVDGTAGGYDRRVEVIVTDPFTIDVAQPPHETTPRNHVIWGMIGYPGAIDLYGSPVGTLCLYPNEIGGLPHLFTLADTYGANPNALAPATPTPWALPVPASPGFPLTVTLQGVMQDGSAALGLSITNAVAIDFVIAPPPVITSVSPPGGVAGDNITINGTDFRPGATIDLGGQTITPTSVSPSALTFIVPGGVGCDSTLHVTNPDGQATTPMPFNATPTVLNTLFPSGTAAGGATFIIQGTGFFTGTTVTIGGAAATISNIGPAVIVMTTPPGTLGSAAVVITTPGGCSASTTYTYL